MRGHAPSHSVVYWPGTSCPVSALYSALTALRACSDPTKDTTSMQLTPTQTVLGQDASQGESHLPQGLPQCQRRCFSARARPAHTQRRTRLYSGFEACFGPSNQGAGIRYKNTSEIQILLASHFKKRGAMNDFQTDWHCCNTLLQQGNRGYYVYIAATLAATLCCNKATGDTTSIYVTPYNT